MPLIYGLLKYTDLKITPPITLRAEIPATKLISAKNRFGTMVGDKRIHGATMGFTTIVCPEGQPDCASPQPAIGVMVTGNRDTNKWRLDIYFHGFYTPQVTGFFFDLFDFGKETDLVIDLTFRDTWITVTVNGKEVFSSDMLKKFEQIREIQGGNYFYDQTHTAIQQAADGILAFNLKIMTPIDISGIASSILPYAVAVAVVGAVIALVTRLLRRPA